jgi:hypothetical protein
MAVSRVILIRLPECVRQKVLLRMLKQNGGGDPPFILFISCTATFDSCIHGGSHALPHNKRDRALH